MQCPYCKKEVFIGFEEHVRICKLNRDWFNELLESRK